MCDATNSQGSTTLFPVSYSENILFFFAAKLQKSTYCNIPLSGKKNSELIKMIRIKCKRLQELHFFTTYPLRTGTKLLLGTIPSPVLKSLLLCNLYFQ
jgi:hypothetical protein